MAIDCNNTVDSGEIAICSCRDAVNSMKEKIKRYDKEMDDYNKNIKYWNSWHREYLSHKRKEQNLTSQSKYKDLSNVTKDWNSCVVHGAAAWEKHDDWCNNDLKNHLTQNRRDWYHHGHTGGGCTPGWSKGTCKITHAGKERLTRQWLAKVWKDHINHPHTKDRHGHKSWSMGNKPRKPDLPPGDTINCCSQVFDDISAGGNVNIQNNTMRCNNKIKRRINAASRGSTSESNKEEKTSDVENTFLEEPLIEGIDNMYIYGGVGILIVIILIILIM